MRNLPRHLTYANVMSTLAAIFALGGGVAYAADTVFSSDIVDGEVKTADIGNNQIRSVDVRDDSLANGGLTGADINEASLDLVQGDGKAVGQDKTVTPGANVFLGPPLAGFLRLSYSCPNPTSNTGFLWIYNDSGSTANVFVDSGERNPTYNQMNAGANFSLPATPAGDSYLIHAQGALGVETIHVATVNRASDCHAQAQALLTRVARLGSCA